MKKRRKIKSPKHAKRGAKKFTAVDIQNIRILSEMLGRLIPYSGLGKFNLRNIAKEFRLHKYLNQKQQNKKESITYFLRKVHKEHPRALKKLVREILPRSVEKRHREGDPILSAEANAFGTVLLRVGIDLRKEIKELNLPASRPTIVPPPHDIQEILRKFILHPYLMPECQKLFLDGHINESVRKALEKYEVYVSNKSGLPLKGKDLMAKAFSVSNPVIQLNPLTTESDRNEQEGIMFISMGIMQWWRNTLSHGDEQQIPHHEAVGRLFLVSNLIRRLELILNT
jgi:uncharacterized protein (TIGR02391 family)